MRVRGQRLLSNRGPLACAGGWRLALALPLLLWAGGCADRAIRSETLGQRQITVAAAANLIQAFKAMGEKFEAESGIAVVLSFGSTADLAHQIANGAPFDVYAAADIAHVDGLIEQGYLLPESKAVYAQGQVVLVVSKGAAALVAQLQDLKRPEIRFIALPKPEFAPYGRAAVEALQALDLWPLVERKIVYAQNVVMAKQLVDTGNAEAAFTARAVMNGHPGRWLQVDAKLYRPIEQAMGVVRRSPHRAEALRFQRYVLSAEGQRLLERFGYQAAASTPPSASRQAGDVLAGGC